MPHVFLLAWIRCGMLQRFKQNSFICGAFAQVNHRHSIIIITEPLKIDADQWTRTIVSCGRIMNGKLMRLKNEYYNGDKLVKRLVIAHFSLTYLCCFERTTITLNVNVSYEKHYCKKVLRCKLFFFIFKTGTCHILWENRSDNIHRQ